MSAIWSLSGEKRTWFGHCQSDAIDPERKLRASGFSTNFPKSFINIKFHVSPFANGGRGKPLAGLPVVVPKKDGRLRT
jgi:hypothetical protein